MSDVDTTTTYSPHCPWPVRHPISRQDWETLTFLHWRFEPDVVQKLLPTGLRVQTFDGAAWVGLVPFQMRVGFGPVPPLPYFTVFPETNVRTYVHGPDGGSGVWFFSLDIPRLVGVVLARATYHVPYMWSEMKVDRSGTTIEYRSCRRFPRSVPAHASIAVRIFETIPPANLTQLDHFLTARWRLYAWSRGSFAYARVEHPPWTLCNAEVLRLDQTLLEGAGLPVPTGSPLAHYSPAIHARLGTIHRI